MEYKLSELTIYEPGQMKGPSGEPQQEDCIYPFPGNANEHSRVFVVCDGMGGIGAGDVAASEVCRTLGRLIDDPEKPFDNDYLTKAIVKAYNAIDKADHGQAKLMGTTMAMLRLSTEGALIAHIGNSRVYHLRAGETAADTQIIYCTEDHTLANKEKHEGASSATEANSNVDKTKVLTRAMLTHAKRRCAPHVHTSSDVQSGDYFLLCTDGLLENLTDDYLRAIFSHSGGSDADKRRELLQTAKDNKDNYSAIIVHVKEVMHESANADKLQTRDIQKPAPKANAKSTNSEPMENLTKSKQEKKFALKLSAKTLLYIMGALAVIMLAYSLFIRTDEVLQPAGMAVDSPSAIPGSGEESYGYEITEQDIRNEAQQIAPEKIPEEEIEQEVEPEETEQAESPVENPQPEVTTTPDEPMIQE